MYQMMTPGPTQVEEPVRKARSLPFRNSDLDPEFYDYYRETCERISAILHTEKETLILSGEGILGLEAACASLTEPGDRVLVLDNGIYGAGFQDFVTLYGGIPTMYTTDYRNAFPVEELEAFLERDHDYKYATVVHCDTPSGVLNDISAICPLLKKYGILTVVDSVSGMIGNEVRADDWEIDLLCGGSQKAVSAPPGLTFVTVSEDAKAAMKNRKTPIASFYCNLAVFEGYYEKQWFPYTMPASDIMGLRAAVDAIAQDKEILRRHRELAAYVRESLREMGLSLYLESGFSDTVTVFEVPEGMTAKAILDRMEKQHGILLAGSFGVLQDKVIRIGHMGANARRELVEKTVEALRETIRNLSKKN